MRKNGKNDGKAKGSSIKFVVRALHSRNYRLFFSGQGVSLIGTWMQSLALSWLVYRLTGSAFLLGLVGFTSQIPSFIFMPFAGVFADKWDRRRILIITQTLMMLQATALSILTFTGTITIWYILPLSFVLGCINSFDMPTRQSFVIDMIERKEDLSNAIALNSALFNGARLVGPSIAGLTIAAVGEAWCFFINAVSYVAVIIALFFINIMRKQKKNSDQGNFLERFKEGFKYAYGFPPIRALLIQIALVSLMGMPYTVLMPVFAKDIFHGGSHTLGFLMGFVGIGALTGAYILASRRSVLGLGRMIVISTTIFGLGILAFSQSRILWLSYIILYFAGMGMILQMFSTNTILQTITEEDKRGRVMSFYTLSFMGMVPFGSLMAGSLSGKIGAPNTLIISGIACLVGAVIFAMKLPSIRVLVRPIYEKKGIIETQNESILNSRNV